MPAPDIRAEDEHTMKGVAMLAVLLWLASLISAGQNHPRTDQIHAIGPRRGEFNSTGGRSN